MRGKYLGSPMINLGGKRWISALVLFAFLSGCASSRVSILPGGRGMPEGKAGDLHVLAVGDEAIVIMLNGSEAKGSVVEVSSNYIVLGHTGNFGYDETRIESQSIDSLVWVNDGGLWPLFAVVAVGAVVWIVDGASHFD